MSSFSDTIRSTSSQLELSILLRQPVSELLGISATATQALKKYGIVTVFDLGTSIAFAAARHAIDLGNPGSAASRFGHVSGDLFIDGATPESPEKIGNLPASSLRALAGSNELPQALDIFTIREMSLWPPYLAARSLVGEASGSTLDPEDLQTEELRPRMGQYPTERAYYSTLAMLANLGLSGQASTELNKSVSIDTLLNPANQQLKPALGALLTFSQSWYSQGVTLGHMLHSLALAPGEATRIAVIDWSRKTSASSSESITEAEELDNSTNHSRALSEVQQAVAADFQAGGSRSSNSSTSTSGSTAMSMSTGLLASLAVSSEGSATLQSATSSAEAESSSWSLGNRSVFGGMSQNINDRTEQHATAVRNRRASAVREVSQSEHEQVSTRIVANYNHMHALTIQYYEVVQIYRTEVKLQRADRCLFVPMEIIDFAKADAFKYVERFRGALIRNSLSRRISTLLIDDTTTVEIRPAVPVQRFGNAKKTKKAKAGGIMGNALPAEKAEALVWDDSEISIVSQVLGRTLFNPISENMNVPDDTEILAISFDGISVASVRLETVSQTSNQPLTVPQDSGRVDLPIGVALNDMSAISISKRTPEEDKGTMTLHCSFLGRRFSLPAIPVKMPAGTAFQRVTNFFTDRANRRKEILEHLQNHREYYSRAIFRSLDSGALTTLLSSLTWNGKTLIEIVEPKPVTVAGNYLILRAPVADNEEAGLQIEGRMATWREYLAARGLELEKSQDTRIVPIPTGGVFAEAVLGRANSAEKLDITRFWNWQDSPIPLSPPEIAPVGTGSRGAAEDLKPGQFSQPIVNITNPTQLPAPTGLGASFQALSNGAMFRDMSGLAGTQANVQSATQATLQAATAAGQLASENMKTAAQKSVAMGQIAADLAKTAIAAGMPIPSLGGGGGAGKVNGISGDGARINHGRDMDKRGVPAPTADLPANTFQASNGADSGMTGSGGGATTPGSGGSSGGYSHEGTYSDVSTLGYSPTAASIIPARFDETLNRWSPEELRELEQDALELKRAREAKETARIEKANVWRWHDLLTFKVPDEIVANLKSRDMEVQTFEAAEGLLNLDYYGVKITRLPVVNGRQMSETELLRWIRLNFNNFIDTDISEFSPYDGDRDRPIWESSSPLGAVIKIDMFDDAAVAATYYRPEKWRFTTIKTPFPWRPGGAASGGHPVSGHREWGVYRGEDGVVTFFCRGADRTTGFPETAAGKIPFQEADQLWLSLQRKVTAFINQDGRGEAETLERFTDQFDWDLVQKHLKKGIPV